MARQADLTYARDPLVRQFKRTWLPRIVRAFRPSEVWLFGSRVRGDALLDSDLDIVVVSDAFAGVPWPNRTTRVLLAARAAAPLEILCYTPAEFRDKRTEFGIVQAAVEEGRRVHPSRRRSTGKS